jgi:Ca-activated chloride channel family protein
MVIIGVAFVLSVFAGVLVGTWLRPDGATPVASANACDGVTLRVYASPDIAGVLSDRIAEFRGTAEDECDAFQVIADSSADVVDDLADGWDPSADGPPPDVWIPEATSWVQLLRATDTGAALVGDDTPSIARSPTVVAMPRPMAKVLGWPGAQLSWADLAELISEPEGWKAHGHEEWGPFKFGLTTPRRSAAAAQSIISVGAALGGVWADELSAESVERDRVRLNLLQLERSVARTDNTTLEQLSGLRRADRAGVGLDFVSAFPIDERQVWRYNAGLPPGTADDDVRLSKPKVRLAAWYPPEGSLALDYPFVVLEGDWVDEERRERALEFLAILQGEETQNRLLRLGFRGANGEVGDVLRRATGIAVDRAGTQVQPPRPKVVQQVLNTWDTVSQRTTTLAVIDVSGSMAEAATGTDGTRLDVATAAAAEAVKLSVDDSGFGLWEFSTDLGSEHHRQLVAMGPLGENVGTVTRRQAVEDALAAMEPRRDTALYETVLAAYREAMRQFDPERVNNLVLLTDGRQDNPDGTLGLERTISRLRKLADSERPVGLIAIGYGGQADLDALERMTRAVGGRAYGAVRANDVREIILQTLTG